MLPIEGKGCDSDCHIIVTDPTPTVTSLISSFKFLSSCCTIPMRLAAYEDRGFHPSNVAQNMPSPRRGYGP